jgi:FkbM family methyltransferase
MRQVNFSGISGRTWLGKLLRLPLRFIPKGLAVPVLQGELRGKKWIVGSSNHGCWLGSYEFEKQMLFVDSVWPGEVVFDIGAHVGFYTLLASELIGPDGRVYAFEPASRNLFYISRHMKLNHCDNVRIFAMAVGKERGVSNFEEGRDSSQGHLSSCGGGLLVSVVSLDELLAAEAIPIPDCMKIDVEGAELEVLEGARLMLQSNHPTIFLATHGRELHKQCCEFLIELGYSLRAIVGDDVETTDEVLAVI